MQQFLGSVSNENNPGVAPFFALDNGSVRERYNRLNQLNKSTGDQLDDHKQLGSTKDGRRRGSKVGSG